MEDPPPKQISTVDPDRLSICAVRDWPRGCGPSAGTINQPNVQTIVATAGLKDPNESQNADGKIENLNKLEVVMENGGSSGKRGMELKVCPPNKRREVSAVRDFPQNCGRNLDINLDLNANNQENDQQDNPKVSNEVSAIRDFPPNCGPNLDSHSSLNPNQPETESNNSKVCKEIALWQPKTENPNPDSSLSAGNQIPIPDLRSAHSSNTDLTSLTSIEENKDKTENPKPEIPNASSCTDLTAIAQIKGKKDENAAQLYDFAIRTITDSRLGLRKTARKSVRAPPKLFLSEKKIKKTNTSNLKPGNQFPSKKPETSNLKPGNQFPSKKPETSNLKPGIQLPSMKNEQKLGIQFLCQKTETSNPPPLNIQKPGTQFPNNKPEASNLHPLIIPKPGTQFPNFLTQQPSNPRNKVKQILRYFHTVYRRNIKKEELKPRVNKKTGFRIDLKSADVVKKASFYKEVNKAILGNVPGVEIGDKYRYRVELHLIGLHRPPQSGIDWTDHNGVRVATSIVSSGGYSDKQCSSDVLIYLGSGGKPTGKKGKQTKPQDQKLEKGNLALKNSMDLKTPVRVIHGSNISESCSKIVMNFTYDGLYLVVDYKYVDEIYNINNKEYKAKVFKFVLRRMEGQPAIGMHLAGKLKSSKVRDGILIKDISNGKEKIPICVINTIDNDKPPKFDYITKMIYPFECKKTTLKGCNCKNCTDIKCTCNVKNRGKIPFLTNGAIVEEKITIHECGPLCKCPPSCPNRVTQKGIMFPLEIFKNELGKWGVRSLNSISSGSFVCEYVGELVVKEETVTIDAREKGNIGRFITRSKSPNLMAQKVLFDHEEEKMAHVMFFAADNILPLQELSY